MLRGMSKQAALDLLQSWRRAVEENNIYGFGLSRMLHFRAPGPRLYDEGFTLKGIFDRNPALWGQKLLGFDILPPEKIKERAARSKIVVFADDYPAISQQLIAAGLEENQDFIFVSDFWTVLCFYKYDGFIAASPLAFFVTERCNLRCEFCGIGLDVRKKAKADLPLENLKRDLKIFFASVDYVEALVLTGGEALLHSRLPELLDFIIDKYNGKIGQLALISNGTNLPSAELLKQLKKHRVEFRISDYSGSNIPDYEKRLRRVLTALEDSGIRTVLVREPWVDTYLDPQGREELRASGEEGLRRHFRRCPLNCKHTLNGYFYACGQTLGAQNAGLLPAEPALDGYDLKGLDPSSVGDRLDTMMFILGYWPEPALQACTLCVGKREVMHEVPKARQA